VTTGEQRRKNAERQRQYRATHTQTEEQRKRAVAATRRWRASHPERHKASLERWHEANPGVAASRARMAKLANLNSRYRSARNSAKRRATAKGLSFEEVDLEALAVRDHWTCWICQGPVDRSIMDRHNPWNMSIDHATPESEGGGWTWENLRLSHYGCNILRGKSSVETARSFAREFMARLAHSGDRPTAGPNNPVADVIWSHETRPPIIHEQMRAQPQSHVVR
jgi:5-methylcytosine-specific restriction endonuclease McrA